MDLLIGTKGDYIIIDEGTERISVRKFKYNLFTGESEDTTVTFPLSALETIELTEPKIFNNGTIILIFDSDDNIFRRYSMNIRLGGLNRYKAEQMVRHLSEFINFT